MNAVYRDLIALVGARREQGTRPPDSADERKYRRLFECSRDAMLFMREEGTISDANPAAVALLKYSQTELEHLTLADLALDAADREAIEALDGFREVNVRLRDGAGGTVHGGVTVGSWGAPHDGTVAIVRDITHALALEEQMRQAQKMEAIGRLAGGIAHDFNNLLTAITGYAELLIENLGTTDPKIQDAYEIRRAALSAARLTRQLLTFSRKHRSCDELLDVNAVVRRTTGILTRTLGEDIELVLQLEPSLKMIKADAGQMEQIVLNLAVNARDAMPNGGRLVIGTTIHHCQRACHHTPPGEYVRLVIADSGCGIPDAIQSKVFEPFFTTKGESGTGLGLATVYAVVQHAGGTIRLDSRENVGTTFTIDLPASAEPVDTQDAGQSAPYIVEGCASIVVVEDDARVRELVELVLRRAGYDVIAVASGEEALALLGSNPDIHLLLTDVVMPRMNGYDLAAEARRIAPGVRIAFMSGFANDVLHRTTDDPFLAKPFTVESLTNIVQQALASES